MFVLSSNRKGAIAEAAIALAAARHGIPVLRPMADHGRFDLGFEIGVRLLRVQCKWGRLDRSRRVIIVKVGGSYCAPSGYVRSVYEEGEIDLLGVYCGDLDRCYLLPSSLVVERHEIHLRLEPPLNGQRACINLAANFEFPGAIAQLGERSAGSRKVGGSSPPSSTPPSAPTPTVVGAHEFRNRFGYWIEQAAVGREVLVTRHGRPFVRLLPGLGDTPPATRPGPTPQRAPAPRPRAAPAGRSCAPPG